MYNTSVIHQLVSFVESNNGIGDKARLAALVQEKFSLTKDRSVYYNDDFAIRFSKSEKKRLANTVLSLSSLQKYDKVPFVVCVVTPSTNHLVLANTSFLKKISQSSKELRADNIKGSFNGSDILYEFEGLENCPENFERLFAYHSGISFEDNLERLVEATNNIVGRIPKFEVTATKRSAIMSSIERAKSFIHSSEMSDLREDLNHRVSAVQGEIAIAALIDNVNLRGRVIEYLITESGSSLKEQIVRSLHDHQPLPKFTTEDKLGDYSKAYPSYQTETDIKTKVLFLSSNPKAYNIDKLLEFLSLDKSVYLIYLVGIDENGKITARLCSVFDDRLIECINVVHHWAGRNTRGVAQFIGEGLENILSSEDVPNVSEQSATFVQSLIDR